MIVNKKSIYYSRLLSDLILLNLSFIVSAMLAQSYQTLTERNYMFILLLILNIFWFFYANVTGLYSDLSTRSYASQFLNIVKISFVQVGISVVFIFLAKEDLFTRNFIVYYGVLIILLISCRTIAFKKILKSLRKKGKNIRNLLIIGAGETGINFKEMISKNPEYGYKFVGYIDNDVRDTDELIGNINQLDEKIKQYHVEETVIALPDESSQKLDEIIRTCNINAVKVHIIPDYFRFLSSRFLVSTVGNFPVITARDEPLEEVNRRFIKRAFDIVFSLLVIILILSWLIPIIAILIKLNSKGSVFFIQDRVGARNTKFKCYKFRTLSAKASEDTDSFHPVIDGDQRITTIGKFLRKSNIDELPQFFNVFKGNMSVVGPRPHAIPYQAVYLKVFEEIKLRHNVKPGITGWAQINGLRGDVEDEVENEKRTIKRMNYDLWYIENWSMKLDIQIILMTIWQMIRGDTKAI